MQRLVSTQDVLFGFGGLVQAPVAGSQVPLEWHWSEAEHVFVIPPEHWPAVQTSPVVQALPSSQVTGLLLQLVELKAGLQIWQTLLGAVLPVL